MRVNTVNIAEVSVWLAGAAVVVAVDAALLGVNPVVSCSSSPRSPCSAPAAPRS